MNYHFSGKCPVCGTDDLVQATSVLWPDLIDSWQLAQYEVDYINRQQGFHCRHCSNNMRSMALAAAIVRDYQFTGTLNEFCDKYPKLDILEINTAGELTPVFHKLTGHKLIEYPNFDMMDLDIENETFDLIIHSDTLEHIPHPERALSECRRVLRADGKCIFTVPIIVDRLTRSRVGLAESYHGRADVSASDQVVYSEFGADVWKCVINSGFSSCEIFAFEYPAALAIIAKK